jgi:glycosyltransferase involved in cell wall biosynthesis
LNTPLVSIIIPVYNAMPYLREALGSVLRQDYPNIEVWVADDDSTDGSYEYARTQAEQDKRLHVIRLEPKKANERRTAVALNKGLEKAAGEYIAMMDADDWCDFNKISRQVAYMEQHPDVIACGTQAKVKWEGSIWKKHTSVSLPLNADELKIYLLRQSPFLQNAVMIRKDCIDSYQLRYNEAMFYAEDYEFFSRLIKLGEIANLDEYLVTYRMHSRQSIKHPDFSKYVRQTVKQNIREAFAVTDEEAELHWQFVNHRNGYDVPSLTKLYQWKSYLMMLNKTEQRFDQARFEKFIESTWQRRVLYHTKYSPALFLKMIKKSNRHYWKGFRNYSMFVFLCKCMMGKKQ